MNSDEFMASPLAGSLSQNNWSVSCKDVKDNDGVNNTVIVSIAFKDDYAGDNSGITMSFRLDDLDHTDIESLETDISSVLDIFDESEETDQIEKELIAENKYGSGDPAVLLNNMEVYPKNPENVITAVSIKADSNFISYGTLDEISDFVDRARDSVESLGRNVLIPYKENEISQERFLNATGYIDIDSSSFYEIQRFEKIGGEDYVRASKVVDGERMPTQCYPVVEDLIPRGKGETPERSVNFRDGNVIPLSSIHFIDFGENVISVDKLFNGFMEHGCEDDKPSSEGKMEDKERRSVTSMLDNILEQMNQNNGNNDGDSDPSEHEIGGRINEEESPKTRPKSKHKLTGLDR